MLHVRTTLCAFLHRLDDPFRLLGDGVGHGSDGLGRERRRLDDLSDHRYGFGAGTGVGLEPLVGGVGHGLCQLGGILGLDHQLPLGGRELHGGNRDADQLVDAHGQPHVQFAHHAHLRGGRPGDEEPALVLGDLDVHVVSQLRDLRLSLVATVTEGSIAHVDGSCTLGGVVADQLHHTDGVDELDDLELVLLVQLVVVADVAQQRVLLALELAADLVQLLLHGRDVLAEHLDHGLGASEEALDAAGPLLVALTNLGVRHVVLATHATHLVVEVLHQAFQLGDLDGLELVEQPADQSVDAFEGGSAVGHEHLGVVQHLVEQLAGLGLGVSAGRPLQQIAAVERAPRFGLGGHGGEAGGDGQVRSFRDGLHEGLGAFVGLRESDFDGLGHGFLIPSLGLGSNVLAVPLGREDIGIHTVIGESLSAATPHVGQDEFSEAVDSLAALIQQMLRVVEVPGVILYVNVAFENAVQTFEVAHEFLGVTAERFTLTGLVASEVCLGITCQLGDHVSQLRIVDTSAQFQDGLQDVLDGIRGHFEGDVIDCTALFVGGSFEERGANGTCDQEACATEYQWNG